MTPEQTRFLLRFVRQLQSCIEKCASTGRPVRRQAGRKMTADDELIDLSIVAEQDEDFPAPLTSHGSRPSS
jgi:hypothetical protein